MDLVIADHAESSVIISIMSEEDVRAALKDPLVGVGHRFRRERGGRPARRTRSRIRAAGDRSRGFSANTCATSIC